MRSRFCEVIVPLFHRHFAFTLLAIVMCGCLQAPADAILGITTAYNADEDNRKINLGVGAYRTEVTVYNVINAGLQCTAWQVCMIHCTLHDSMQSEASCSILYYSKLIINSAYLPLLAAVWLLLWLPSCCLQS